MIYITADPHREFESILRFCRENKTTPDDVMIILGDAGINYYLDYDDDKVKSELTDYPITFFCVHGNHEEKPKYIRGYKEKIWRGGSVYYEEAYPNLFFAKDGEIFSFNGKKAIVIGGAYSVDKYRRLRNGTPWFCSEQLSESEKAYVEQQLEKCDWKIDYVLSHTAPLKYAPDELFLPFADQSGVDRSMEEWLDAIENRLDYETWYSGHYHCDREVEKVRILYWNIRELK